MLFMPGLDALRLLQHLLRRRDDDHHIDGTVGMVVLIGDVIDVFRHRQVAGMDVGHRHRCVEGQREIVETETGTRRLGDRHLVSSCRQTVDVEIPDILFCLRITVEFDGP